MVYAHEQAVNRNGNAFYMLLYEKTYNSYIIKEMKIKITL